MDATVATRAKAFVTVKVDGDDREDLVKLFGVRDLPCLAFFTPDGGLLARRENDYQNTVQDVVAVMEKALGAFTKMHDLEKASAAAPQDLEKLRDLALAYNGLQLWDKAAATFESYLTLDRDDAVKSRAKAEECLVYVDMMRERFDAGILRAETYQAHFPKSKNLTQVLYWKGICLLKSGKTPEAVKAWQAVVERAPDGTYGKLAREAIDRAGK